MAVQEAGEFLKKLKAKIGKEIVYQAPDEISRASIRKYALAIGDFNPLYTDREVAKEHGLRDVVAPPTLVCDTWQYIDSHGLDERGDLLGRGEALEVMGLRAGNDYEFFRPVYPDDVITACWKIQDVYEKTGRSGRLVFWDIQVSYYNQHSELLTRETEVWYLRF